MNPAFIRWCPRWPLAVATALGVLTAACADQELAAHVDATLVETYVRLVRDGRTGEAFDRCLSRNARAAQSRDTFVAAHRKRRQDKGTIQGRRLVTAQVTRNLFSPERTVYLEYLLQLPEGEEPVDLVAHDADGEWRIERTGRRSANDTIDDAVW